MISNDGNESKNQTKNIFKILAKIFVIVFLCFVVYFSVFKPISIIKHYYRVYQNPLTVEATVTDHNSYTDDDGDTDYTSYITYSVNGKTYEDIKYQKSDKLNELTKIGRSVNVEVSPEDPSKLISALKKNGGFLFWGVVFTSAILAAAYRIFINNRRSGALSYMPEQATIVKDVKLTIQGRFLRPFFMLCGISFITIYHLYPLIFSSELLSYALILGVCWAWCLIRAIYFCRLADNGNFTVTNDVLIKKTTRSDDDGDTYFLHYRSAKNAWSTSVTKAFYDKAREGDTVISVYFPKKKKPIIHYNCNGCSS